ncbi:MAG: diaminopimelate epimerase [bacterium]|nr:diaminopimelate epimerase [bacterium]
MRFPFAKMNGAGNDFILIDNRAENIQLGEEAIRFLCGRRRGIGADGLILLDPGGDVDFRMRYYNSDGREAEMCGNGARCVALFAGRLGLGHKADGETRLRFVARPGPMEATVRGGSVAVRMTDATGYEEKVSISVADREEIVHVINSGVPHAVAIETDISKLSNDAIVERGRAIRNHSRFSPGGANANFASVRPDGTVDIRTYERGVEAETLSCGTGAVATAVVVHRFGLSKSPVTLHTHGGESLVVSFTETKDGATDVVLDGPAAVNFEGSVDLHDMG